VLSELVSFRLELLGFNVESVVDGGQAAAAISRELPDLLIVDTMLRDGDGLEWIARTRSEYSADRLPIIVFSLDPSLETVERSYHAGAQDYLITPFDPTVMEEKIESLFLKRPASMKGHQR
jgi:DNA-binding response OmpR family regulator